MFAVADGLSSQGGRTSACARAVCGPVQPITGSNPSVTMRWPAPKVSRTGSSAGGRVHSIMASILG